MAKTINTGVSVNNIEIKDMQPKIDGFDYETYISFQKRYEKEVNINEITLSAKVKQKTIRRGKDIIDKTTNLPVLDSEGEVRKYDDSFFVTLLFEGGSLEHRVDEEKFNQLEENERYKFVGYIGMTKEYGKEIVGPIFTSFSII